jgi:2-polyprenyl-6-methoxyphenol hydroxylase-like FAD-dependent oxidoreductase
MKPKRYDVLVIGARCAGAATAMLLARSGLEVLVVDRSQYGADALSTHALMRGGVLQLSRWGLIDRLLASDTPVIETTTFHYAADSIPVDIRPLGDVRGLLAPRRTVLDRLLVDAARDAGAEIRFGARLVELVHDPSGRVSGAVIAEAGARRTIDAGIVVGADGVRSTVAELVGAPTDRHGPNQSAVIYGYFTGLPNRGYHWYYDIDVSAGEIPTNGGHCVFAAMPPNRLRGAGVDVARCFAEVIAESAPELARAIDGAQQTGAFRRAFGIPGHMRRAWGPGWALVGDAGYFKDPLTAHGITDALRDAELLARAIARGGDDALANYQQTRDELSIELFELSDRIASFDWSLDQLQQLHRALSGAMRREVHALIDLDHPGRRAA